MNGGVAEAMVDASSGMTGFVQRLGRCLPYAVFLFFLVLALIMNGSFGGEFYAYRAADRCDGANYIKMAEETFAPVENPFALRVLSPLIVHVVKKNSPLGWDATWYLLTFCAIFASAALVFRFMRYRLRIGALVSTFFVLFLLHTSCYTQFHFHDPFRIDPMNNLLWIVALYALFSDRYRIFCMTLIVGFMNKEVILLLAPLYPLFMWIRHGKLRHWDVGKSILAVMGIVLAYITYRTAVVHRLGEGYVLLGAYQRSALETVQDAVEFQKDLYAIFFVFSFLWVMFFYALYEVFKAYGWRNRYLLATLYLLAALLFGRLFARDANRVFSMLAPLVIPISAVFFSCRTKLEGYLWLPLMLLSYAAINLGWAPQKHHQVLFCVVVLVILAIGRQKASPEEVRMPQELGRI